MKVYADRTALAGYTSPKKESRLMPTQAARRSSIFRRHACPPALAALTLALPAAPAALADASPAPPEPTVLLPATAELAKADFRIRDALDAAGPDTAELLQHVATLTNPWLGGRAPGDRGGRLAADYLAHHFAALGLDPAFPELAPADPAALPADLAHRAGYLQPFRLAATVASAEGSLLVPKAPAFEQGDDFTVMGFSASGSARAPLAFAGYSIADGPGGYSSFLPPDDAQPGAGALEGRIAVMLRFEPMDPDGRSRWGRGGGSWSGRAGLESKIRAAREAGAVGVLLVNHPDADDPRAGRLAPASRTSYGFDAGVPVLMLTADAADALLRAAGEPHWTIDALKVLADRGSHQAVRLGDRPVEADAAVTRRPIDAFNVGGVLRGAGPLADEIVAIGAHFDHLGDGSFGSRDPAAAGETHPGADDNASGTAGLVVAARRLARAYDRLPADTPRRSILFLGFDAEERGLLGARHLAASDAGLDDERLAALLNMDMIGRLRDDALTANGTGTAPIWNDLLPELARRHGIDLTFNPAGAGASDHTPFYRAGVPVLHFISNLHPDYHTPRDTFDTLNYAGAARVVAFVADLALELATRDDAPEFASTTPPRPDIVIGVQLGRAAPDEPGVPVMRPTPGDPADRAGVAAGDRIVELRGVEIDDVNDLLGVLMHASAGDELPMTVVRDGERLELNIVPRAR